MTMPQPTAADLLQAAAEMADALWIQHRHVTAAYGFHSGISLLALYWLFTHDGIHPERFDAIGLLVKAAADAGMEREIAVRVIHQALAELRAVVEPRTGPPPQSQADAESSDRVAVHNWSDTPGRSVAQVEQALITAARHARQTP